MYDLVFFIKRVTVDCLVQTESLEPKEIRLWNKTQEELSNENKQTYKQGKSIDRLSVSRHKAEASFAYLIGGLIT